NKSKLNKILNEFSDNVLEKLWIYINSKLKGFFEHNMVLKPNKDEKLKIYLKLIEKLQNYCSDNNNCKDEIIEFSKDKAPNKVKFNITNDIIEFTKNYLW
ncbi:36278_t:CDS:2, partial [Gigaspora margarita]